jgi:hypothetical protein
VRQGQLKRSTITAPGGLFPTSHHAAHEAPSGRGPPAGMNATIPPAALRGDTNHDHPHEVARPLEPRWGRVAPGARQAILMAGMRPARTVNT